MGSSGIVMGIGEYFHLSSLAYAPKDAERFRAFLLQQSRFDRQHIYYFYDQADPMILPGNQLYPANPTVGNIRTFLQSRFGSKSRSFLTTNDDLWFFFSGHGYQYGNQDYLMPADATPNAIEETGLMISNNPLKKLETKADCLTEQ